VLVLVLVPVRGWALAWEVRRVLVGWRICWLRFDSSRGHSNQDNNKGLGRVMMRVLLRLLAALRLVSVLRGLRLEVGSQL
jgi:hypothetical protein